MGEGMKEKAIVSWSGGKDSALALYDAQKDFEIVALLTTVTEQGLRIKSSPDFG
jgi:diphthamide synthase (EF-2-diphthine--ammonia ligase)